MTTKIRFIRSVKPRLLIPSFAAGAILLGIGAVAMYETRRSDALSALSQRAELVANLASHVADGVAQPGELQRVVSELGRTPGVVLIAVAFGNPPRVLASTKEAWIGRLVADLPRDDAAPLLQAALAQRGSALLPKSAPVYAHTSPIRLSKERPELLGAVTVQLNTRDMQTDISDAARWLAVAFVFAMLIFGGVVHASFERVILRPLAEIGNRVAAHRQGASDVLAPAQREDELREVAQILNDALLRTDAALRDLAYQKFALDQHDIVSIADARGRITYANDNFCAISKFSREELIGADHNIVNSGYHPREFFAQMWSTIKSGNVWRGELRNRAKDGSYYWTASTIVPLLGPTGVPDQYIAIRTDVTEHKRTAADLTSAKIAAEAASTAKSEFLANMSHEIRTPMNAVIATTGLLLDTQLDQEQRELVETVRRGGEALLVVINDILDYSKIEAGKLDLERRTFDVRDVVESAIDLFAAQVAEKNIELILKVEDNVPPFLLGDETRIRQVLVNFISNAIKFTDVGQVLLTVACLGRNDGAANMCFSVRDSGVGISPAKLSQLFHAFTQGDASTTRRVGGTGLGLAICRRLATMMGGDVRAESVERQGSTFSFRCSLPEASITQPPPEDLGTRQLAGKRLLIIDDNSHLRAMLLELLRGFGATVATASTPAEAQRAFTEGPDFHAILLDQRMPELGGVELAAKLRQIPGKVVPPLVLLSTRNTAAPTGFTAVVAKPIRPRVLLSVLNRLFGLESLSNLSEVTSGPTLDAQMSKRYPLRILLAEDNPVNQRVASMILARMGYRADVVADGAEALTGMRSHEYDLVFMDVHMPEMDGLEATRRIRALTSPGRSRPWIVALTASAMENERSAATEAGMDDFISKPVRVEDIQRAVLRAAEGLARRISTTRQEAIS